MPTEGEKGESKLQEIKDPVKKDPGIIPIAQLLSLAKKPSDLSDLALFTFSSNHTSIFPVSKKMAVIAYQNYKGGNHIIVDIQPDGPCNFRLADPKQFSKPKSFEESLPPENGMPVFDRKLLDPAFTEDLKHYASTRPQKQNLTKVDCNKVWPFAVMLNPDTLAVELRIASSNHAIVSMGYPIFAGGDIIFNAEGVIKEITDKSGGYMHPEICQMINPISGAILKAKGSSWTEEDLIYRAIAFDNALLEAGVPPGVLITYDESSIPSGPLTTKKPLIKAAFTPPTVNVELEPEIRQEGIVEPPITSSPGAFTKGINLISPEPSPPRLETKSSSSGVFSSSPLSTNLPVRSEHVMKARRLPSSYSLSPLSHQPKINVKPRSLPATPAEHSRHNLSPLSSPPVALSPAIPAPKKERKSSSSSRVSKSLSPQGAGAMQAPATENKASSSLSPQLQNNQGGSPLALGTSAKKYLMHSANPQKTKRAQTTPLTLPPIGAKRSMR